MGSTHRRDPHPYGVSYFSARGPTGDGRRKPDILAPGEKITSTIRGGRSQRMDGTSMAAPHVGGAAALLMARYPELIGHPLRIKEILMRPQPTSTVSPAFRVLACSTCCVRCNPSERGQTMVILEALNALYGDCLLLRYPGPDRRNGFGSSTGDRRAETVEGGDRGVEGRAAAASQGDPTPNAALPSRSGWSAISMTIISTASRN